MKWSSTGIRNR